MPDRMYISLRNKKNLMKNEIMMLDMIANCNWERPLFIATTVASSSYLNLDPYFVLEGLAYRITPFNWKELGYNAQAHSGTVLDTDKAYDNLMSFNFGGCDNPDIYLDETVRRMCYSHRRIFAQLAGQLIQDGDNERASKILAKLEEGISSKLLPHDFMGYSSEIAKMYIMIGEKEKAAVVLEQMATDNLAKMAWYLTMDNKRLKLSAEAFTESASILYSYILPSLQEVISKETFEDTMDIFDQMYDQFNKRVR